jgi:hypothetical protein
MTDILRRLKGVRKSGEGWTARCPAHDDKQNSLSLDRRDGRWLLKCHAGCDIESITRSIDLSVRELFDDHGRGRGGIHPSGNRATAQPSAASGLTLEQYATAKRLPLDLLRSCGVSEITYDHGPAVRIPYFGPGGELLAVRFRIALEGDRFRWKAGSKPQLYGLNRITEAREAGYVVLVEGESDVHTFWHHGIPAVGVPGAANWREDRDAQHLEGIEKIYVVIEPDRGGDTVRKWLSQSALRHRVLLVSLPVKDASELHLAGGAEFKKRWQVACLGAMPWTAVEQQEGAEERSDAWHECAELASTSSILDEVDRELARIRVVGERRGAKLIYLAVTSRLLERPVSVVIKGPSSGGKSFLTESVLRLFPPAAFYALTAMSDRALAYSTEPLKHRHLVVYEAAGMAGEFATYLIRSLLSEGRLRYETVEKTRDGLVPKLIEREGPTGLIVTTTALRLHPENETRMLSLTLTDTREQTAFVFQALADESRDTIDLTRWHALQTWLATGPADVIVPFAKALATLVPPVAVRLRRDFKTVLTLIRAHALLHQATRRKDAAGRIIATIEDYTAIRNLVADLVAAGVEATVRPEVRETVSAVTCLIESGKSEVRQADLRARLKLDKSVISRRVADAVDRGYLRNLEDRKGRPARLVIGDGLPQELEVLPTPERLHGCAVVRGNNGSPSPFPCCAACGAPGSVDDPFNRLLEAANGDGFDWVHSECLEAWSSAAWQLKPLSGSQDSRRQT